MKQLRRSLGKYALITTAMSLIAFANAADKTHLTQSGSQTSSPVADLIISGGPIITMDSTLAAPEAVAVRDGKILAVGSAREIDGLRGDSTEQLELNGNTLLPGFIDGHSHFSMAVNSASWANLSAAPVGNVGSIADIVAELQAQGRRNKLAPGDWLVGYGYDQDTLEEGRHATRDDLDAAFPAPISAVRLGMR